MPIVPATPQSIARAAELLRSGELVAFPTETVYGLGADATNDRAVASIYRVKQRPEINPLIIHVASLEGLEPLVEMNDEAKLLARTFWPGPLTCVLARKSSSPVSLSSSAGLETIAVRIPSHPVALELIHALKAPIAAPSANLSGKVSPTTPLHVEEGLGSRVAMILASGRSKIGLESTILDLTGKVPTILRHGGVTKEQLLSLLSAIDDATTTAAGSSPPKAPGQLLSHYAPDLPVRMNATNAGSDEAYLTFGNDRHHTGGAERMNLSQNGDLEEAASNLFAMLRSLDRPQFRAIAVMPIPHTGIGAAINDRLKRASFRI